MGYLHVLDSLHVLLVMTQIYVAQNPTDAHFIAGLLESEGIPAEIRGEPLFGARGEVPPSPSTLPTVWVEDERAAEARAILANPGRVPGEVGEQTFPWRCGNCGELVEAQFAVCWKCGTAR